MSLRIRALLLVAVMSFGLAACQNMIASLGSVITSTPNEPSAPISGGSDDDSLFTPIPTVELGGADFITTQLASVFGQTSDTNPIFLDLIDSKRSIYGQSCSIYDPTTSPCTTVDFVGNSALSRVTPRMDISTARSALIHRACLRLVDMDSSLSTAVSRITGSAPTWAAATPLPTSAQLEQIFELFYWNVDASAGIVADLGALSSAAANAEATASLKSKRAWQAVYLSVCQSGFWSVVKAYSVKKF